MKTCPKCGMVDQVQERQGISYCARDGCVFDPRAPDPSRTVILGQIGIVLIMLGLMFTLGLFLSLNFSDPGRSDYANARQIIRVIGSALVVAGLFLIGFLTVPSHPS